MTGLATIEIASSEIGRQITIHLAAESARAGLKLGYRIPTFGGATAEKWSEAGRRDVYEELDTMLMPQGGGGRNWRASMAQDVIKGRRSEIDFMNGHVVAMGREVGVATSVSAVVVSVVKELDAGTRRPSPDHLKLALDRAGL
jgi:2-dehydropantoate 2-reductase